MLHGTNAGFSWHQRAGEKPCAACIQGKAEYDREYRKREVVKIKIKARAKAQHRAIQHLVEAYRPQYNALYLGGEGDTAQRQRDARRVLIKEHKGKYRDLYTQFAQEELEKANVV